MIFISEDQKQYKANLHSHSVLSDGMLDSTALVDIYRKNGYSILAITDHEYPKDHSDLTTDDFLLITGYEAYIRPSKLCLYDRYEPEIHLNLIARDPHNEGIVCFDPVCSKYMPPLSALKAKHYGRSGPRKFTVRYIQSFIDSAVEHGYLVSLNHPCWSMQDTSDLLELKGLWSVEIFNTGSMNISGYAENMPVYDFLLRKGKCGTSLYCHGADDNHNKKPLGDPLCDSFGAWTMIMSEDLSYDSVIKALEKGQFYASTGPSIKALSIDEAERKAYLKTTPAKRITMHMTPKFSKVVYDKMGGEVDTASFDIPSDAPYVYFSVIAADGTKAYTHAFDVKKKKKK